MNETQRRRFDYLLEKRKEEAANIKEEEELINLSELLTDAERGQYDPVLFTYTNTPRLDNMFKLLDKMLEIITAKDEADNEKIFKNN